MKITRLLVGLVLGLGACERPLPASFLPQVPARPVLYLLLSPGEDLTGFLTSSQGPLDVSATPKPIAGTEIFCFRNDTLAARLVSAGEWQYTSDTAVQVRPGERWYAVVNGPVSELVRTAPIYIPGTPAVARLEVRDSVFFDLYSRVAWAALDLWIQSQADVPQYYTLQLQAPDGDYVQHDAVTSTNEALKPCLAATKVWTDSCLAGELYQVTVFFVPPAGDSLIVNISTLSDAYFQYLVTAEAADIAGGLELIFSRPVAVHNNIIGGYGLAGGRVDTTVHINW